MFDEMQNFKSHPQNTWFQNHDFPDHNAHHLFHEFKDRIIKFSYYNDDINLYKDNIYFSCNTVGNKYSLETFDKYETKTDAASIRELVADTIEHFDQKETVSFKDISGYLKDKVPGLPERKQDINHEKPEPEDIWIDKGESFGENIEKMYHSFDDKTIVFLLYHNEDGCEITFNDGYDYSEEMPKTKTVEDAKETVKTVIEHFSGHKNVNMETLNNFTQNSVDIQDMSQENRFKRQLDTAEKTGYVQGVCESVIAVSSDKLLGKLLLSEMKITKEMAKKFAHPETFKELEQGIFAPQQELNRTQGIKR